MQKKKCERMTVTAVGINTYGNMKVATNGNYNENGCTNEVGKCGCVHAEEELINEMGRYIDTVILSHSPCLDCAIKLCKARVKTVIYVEKYRKINGIVFLKKNNVKVHHAPFFSINEEVEYINERNSIKDIKA